MPVDEGPHHPVLLLDVTGVDDGAENGAVGEEERRHEHSRQPGDHQQNVGGGEEAGVPGKIKVNRCWVVEKVDRTEGDGEEC